MAVTKEKKSFKKFAKKHLAGVIETRRKTAKSKKEKLERLERKKAREAKNAAREEKEHMDQLERLKDTDPEFYSYLEEEDPTLLEFGKEDIDVVEENDGSDAETEMDDEESRGGENDEDNGEADGGDEEGSDGAAPRRGRITREEVTQLTSAGSGVESCIDVFVSAVRELGYQVKEHPRPQSTRKFEEPALVKEALVSVAQHVGKQLSTFITGKGSFKSHKTRMLVKRLLMALSSVIGEGNIDAVLSASLLHAIVPFVPLLHYVRGVTKTVLKASLHLCAAPEESVRVAAYMVVRSVATRAAGTRSMYQSTAFKGIFLTLIRTAHQYNIHNQTTVAFLMNCVVDLYGTDMEAAYQHTFVYLRQLAIYLRAALQQQTQSNVRAVVNWQYLNALRTWGAVVSTYSEPNQLGPLIHPVVQIATALMDLFSSPRMFPMHLQIIEVMNHIASRADGLYIPVAPYLLRILTSPSVALSHAQNGVSSSADRVDLLFTIRVKKSQARNSVYHRDVWNEALYLLTEHLATHSHTVGFPEAFWAVESTLRKLRTQVRVPKVHSSINNLLRHIQTTSQKIKAKRDQANFGPCDLAAVKQFEDELKQKGSALASYYHTMRQQRIDDLAAKHKDASGERVTLESVAGKHKNSRTADGKRNRPQVRRDA
ncbi:Noc2p family protein [Leishmania donovani]|uniref:Noc2p family protein n=1 Tax=Leishmania donovani TaxID=5661 RepID=A0A504Y3E3_LEIDO|nr:Noc2p family protein [Leishmania donovani]